MSISGFYKGSTDRREMYYAKGSLEAVLDRCRFYYVSEDSTPGLDPPTRLVIIKQAQDVASRGLRVIATAYGYGSVESIDGSGSAPPSAALNLVFTGFQAMMDPPRKGVADAITLLHSGGVQVVMITGDAPETALSVARQLGLRVSSTGSGSSSCLTGAMIDRMTERQLRERVANVTVFARTTPKHKMAIISAFQSRGAVVGMTGDGGTWFLCRRIRCGLMSGFHLTLVVNDAPALKMADIGISMGRSGTDVAKEAADVILVDDNFGTILSAVEEGM